MYRAMTVPLWSSLVLFCLSLILLTHITTAVGDESFQREASWQRYDVAEMEEMLRRSLDELGVAPSEMDTIAEQFVTSIEENDTDSLDAFVSVVSPVSTVVGDLVAQASHNPIVAADSIDPDTQTYVTFESLPATIRMSVRTWLGRKLVRARLYDEALPVIAETEPTESVDPAAVMFYRGACYHALLMKKEALTDLRRLLENKDACPRRFERTAQLMIADIKPLKEDSLDEISRLMTDVTRRLDLGRSGEDVKDREQQVIDKLTKLIEKIEEQQQQQQQQRQQQSGGQGGQGGQGAPMEDSQIAGANGVGDVDRKNIEQKDGWGNLPPAERQQALQQISRDLPTHYREAIEAYFRKLATEK